MIIGGFVAKKKKKMGQGKKSWTQPSTRVLRCIGETMNENLRAKEHTHTVRSLDILNFPCGRELFLLLFQFTPPPFVVVENNTCTEHHATPRGYIVCCSVERENTRRCFIFLHK